MSDRNCHGDTEPQREEDKEKRRQGDKVFFYFLPPCLCGKFSVRVALFHNDERVIPACGYRDGFVCFFAS